MLKRPARQVQKLDWIGLGELTTLLE